MTEAEYEHECRRAELLGIDMPNRDEFFSRTHAAAEQPTDVEDPCVEVTEKLDRQGESINRTAGGLDEINNILSVTQKKINHLKTVCGSFTSILKLQSHSSRSETCSSVNKQLTSDAVVDDSVKACNEVSVADSKAREIHKSMQSDVESTVGVQLSKLDSIIMKAEKANFSLSSQNKQMKILLKK